MLYCLVCYFFLKPNGNIYSVLKVEQILGKYYLDKNEFNKQNNLITIIYNKVNNNFTKCLVLMSKAWMEMA